MAGFVSAPSLCRHAHRIYWNLWGDIQHQNDKNTCKASLGKSPRFSGVGKDGSSSKKGRPKKAVLNMIGPNVAKARHARGWSQSDLARACQLAGFDTSLQTIGHIEGQTRKVSDIEIALLCKALGIPFEHPLFPAKIPPWQLRPWGRDKKK